MVYRFRVTYEDHEDVFRDIEIRSSQSFLELHSAIQQAISFDNSKSASFYMSDDYWRKEEEISVENTSEEKTKKSKSKKEESPKKKTIADLVNDPHQKFIYVFDPEREWTFLIELLKIIPENKTAAYPQCVKSSGTAPKQYKPTNLPPPPDEEEPILPLPEKEIIIDVPEEKISSDDVEEGAILLDEEDVKAGEEEEEGAGEDEEAEGSEGFDLEDVD